MKISKALLAYLIAGIVFMCSSCSDDDDQERSGKLVIRDKTRVLQSSAIGFRHTPHLDAQGKTYYIHEVTLFDFDVTVPVYVGKSTNVSLTVTSSSATTLDSGQYVMPVNMQDIHAGQIRMCSFSIDGGNNETPDKYSGYAYGLTSGTATITVLDKTCAITLNGTVYGNSEKSNHETGEVTMSYTGPLYDMFVVE